MKIVELTRLLGKHPVGLIDVKPVATLITTSQLVGQQKRRKMTSYLKSIQLKGAVHSKGSLVNHLDTLIGKIIFFDPNQKCVTCGVDRPRWSLNNRYGLQVGHYYSRKVMPLRWDLRNCHPQCPECNARHETDHKPYTRFMLEEYGELGLSEVALIHQTSYQSGASYSKTDLQSLIIGLEKILEDKLAKSSLESN